MVIKDKPIGVFDSGIGGLTVVKALRKILPYEKITYFGDTARVPYGTKSRETIIKFATEDTEFLLSKDVKMIIVACNTVSANAIEELEKSFDIPIIGVLKPGAKSAVKTTKTGKIGVIGTTSTIVSSAYTLEMRELNPDVKVFSQACSLFVPIIEEGWEDSEVAVLTARQYLASLTVQDIDTLVLGCTHYPLLKNTIKIVVGDQVELVDSARETAEEVFRILKDRDLLSSESVENYPKFYLSDIPPNFVGMAERFLGEPISHVERV